MSVPVIDGYSDLEQVARGGFGIVYRGRREHLDQDVALKVLALADLSERDRDRFQRECRAAGNLSWHPHVVAVHDSGITADGHPYLAMEYLDAGTLADRIIAEGPLPWADAVDVTVQVTGALGAAHAAGTLHRDLKPENILVGPFGEAKLGDFGIAAVEGGSRTATGHAAYTVTHVAPEILRGQRPDERSDLYGLASTLFTLLTGRTPFSGDDPDEPVATVITRVLTEPAPHLTGITEGLASLLEQTLDKDPDLRPQTAQAFGEALQGVQRDNDRPVTDLRLARTTTAAKPATDPDATAPRGDNRRTIHVGPTTTPPPDQAEPEAAPEPVDPNATITIVPAASTPPSKTAEAPSAVGAVSQTPSNALVVDRGARLFAATLLGLGGLVLLLLSLPLSWYTVDFTRETNGLESFAIDLGYVYLSTAQYLLLAVATALIVLATVRRRHRLRGVTLAVLGVYALTQVIGAYGSVRAFSGILTATVGIGLFVALVGAFAMLAGAVIDLVGAGRRSAPESAREES